MMTRTPTNINNISYTRRSGQRRSSGVVIIVKYNDNRSLPNVLRDGRLLGGGRGWGRGGEYTELQWTESDAIGTHAQIRRVNETAGIKKNTYARAKKKKKHGRRLSYNTYNRYIILCTNDLSVPNNVKCCALRSTAAIGLTYESRGRSSDNNCLHVIAAQESGGGPSMGIYVLLPRRWLPVAPTSGPNGFPLSRECPLRCSARVYFSRA